jgi:hypothetical protein
MPLFLEDPGMVRGAFGYLPRAVGVLNRAVSCGRCVDRTGALHIVMLLRLAIAQSDIDAN